MNLSANISLCPGKKPARGNFLLLFAAMMMCALVSFGQDQPEALFLAPEQVCAPASETIKNESLNATTYRWFVDGTEVAGDFSGDLTWNFENSAGFPYTDRLVEIRLEAENTEGISSFTKEIKVLHEVEASFTRDPVQGCHALEVEFTNTSTGNTGTWVWNFGDGGSSGDESPSHEYFNFHSPTDEIYTVTLEAISPNGLCKSTASSTVTVTPFTEALFSIDTIAGCGTIDVEIENLSTLWADEYRWNMGDGSPDIITLYGDPPITHTYNNPGGGPLYFTITLTVTDGVCTDVMEQTVTVYPAVNAGFTANPSEGCSELTVEFINNSVNGTDYLWEFGDGGTNWVESPFHTYPKNLTDADVTYDVRLFALSNGICRDSTNYIPITVRPHVEADFALDKAEGCHPLALNITNNSLRAVTWLWEVIDPGNNIIQTGNAETFNPLPLQNTGHTNPVDYTIRLTAFRGTCSDIIERTVTVYPDVLAAFSAIDPPGGCSPHSILFNNLSQGASLTWHWDFGDGGSSDEEDPVHEWERNMTGTDKVYEVRLTATSADLCSHVSDPVEVTVYPYIEAGFVIDYAEGCHPFTVTITDQSHGASDYTWTMGDGTTYINPGSVFTHEYQNTGTTTVDRTIRLDVENPRFCNDFAERTITVYPELISDFTASFTDSCDPLTVQFTNQSVNADTYHWDFGDGEISYDEDPLHTFYNPDITDTVFTVVLTSYSAGGECIETSSMNITVNGRVTAGFSFIHQTGCNQFDVEFINSSHGATSYSWDFGDGSMPINTTSALPVSHIFGNSSYSASAEYTVTLTAWNDAGCPDIKTEVIKVYPDISALFSVSSQQGCQPLTVDFENLSQGGFHYHWDFDDGNTSGESDPQHTFINTRTTDRNYNVRLVTTAENNVCSDSFFMNILVHPYVQADFDFTGSPGCTPFDVLFENSSVNAIRYHWDFDDGNDSTIYNNNPFTYRFTNTSFSSVASYQVTMTAYSNEGCEHVISKTVNVYPDIIAEFLPDATEGCHPFDIGFTNTSSGGFHYAWDFGDKTSSAEGSPRHTFTNTGTVDSIYTVTLLVTAENNACSDEYSIDITVHPYINAGFDFTEAIQCTPAEFNFTNSSTGGTLFRWDFGDGTDSITYNMTGFARTFANPSFNDAVEYIVTLEAENSAGCTHQVQRSVNVYPDVRAMVTPSVSEGCHPLTVDFENVSRGGYTFQWDFGDGSATDKDSPSHTFTNFTNSTITRVVKLSATSQAFCYSDTSFTITIHPLPKPFINIENSIACPPFDLEIENGTVGAQSYRWFTGDGESFTTGSALPFTHRYLNTGAEIAAYDLRLIAETEFGCIDSAMQKVHVYPDVITSFSSVTEGCSPLTVRFTDESVRAAENIWDLGDGSVSRLKDPVNHYFNNTLYDTSFTVQQIGVSRYGCRDTMSYLIDVYPQPVTEFIAQPTHQTWPSARVELTNTTNPGYWNFAWDFDDGNTSSLKDPGYHTFSDYGNYQISLHAFSDHCSHTVTHTVRVLPAPPIPNFNIPDPGCVPHPVQFINNSVYGHTWLWDFGDGNTSTEAEPFHVFEIPGIYNVTLTVTGDGGTRVAYREVEAYSLPVADFTVAPELVMLPGQKVQLFNLSENGYSYLWDLGDGTQSSEQNPVHQYTETGEFDISLRAWTVNECYSEVIKYNSVRVTGEGIIRYPNAFRPDIYGPSGGYYDRNAINPNTVFYPLHAGIEEYRLEIYNRWGELLFVSEDVDIGWDGYYKGMISKQDVYVWKVWGTFINGVSFIKAGDVTLLR
ncbi:MAG: PKD domain-containing protein [Bacteroidales bacterium]